MDLKPAGAMDMEGVLGSRAEAATGTLWLPWLVGCYFAFRPAFVVVATRALGQDPQAGTAISLGLNFLLLTLAVLQSIGAEPRTSTPALRGPNARWVLAFLAFAGCSLSWTFATSLAAAAAYWCGMVADVAIIVLLVRAHGPIETARSLISGFVFGAFCFALLGWALPRQSDLRLGDEDYLGANEFGFVCAFALLLGQYGARLQADRKRWTLAAVFLVVTLLRTLSKTNIIAFLVAELFLFARDATIARRTKVITFLGGCVLLAASWGLISAYLDSYLNAGNQAETLTGRVGLWAIFLDESLQRPWIGHGFHSVWKVIPPYGPEAFEPRHAHNELVQQFYAYGAVGVLLLFGLYGSFFRCIKELIRSPQRTALFSLLIFMLVRGLADTDAFDLSLPLWAMILLGATMAEIRLQTCPASSLNASLAACSDTNAAAVLDPSATM
jgi:O-antigen ligase